VSEAWKGGSTREWRKIREAVLEDNRVTNGGLCRAQCVGICTGTASHAHHTLGRQITGDDPRFIVAICGPCNIHIGDPQKHPVSCAACVNVTFGPHAVASARGAQKLQPTIMTKW
jgi:hypothetical protein